MIQDRIPILASRAARLRRAPKNMFGSVNSVSRYSWWGVESTARCRRHLRHVRCPDPGCSCGFYAVPADRQPVYGGPQYVTLDVELAGRVIIHERGYRAEWQRVLGVRIDPCHQCGGRRTRCGTFSNLLPPWIYCPGCVDIPLFGIARAQARLRKVEWLLEKLPVPWTIEGEGER